MKVTYIGDPLDLNEGPAVITHHGETFEKGKAREVDDDHPFAEGFRTNPTFKVEGQKPPVRMDVDHMPTERDAVIERLEAMGQKVDKRQGLAALQEQEAKANADAEAAAAKARASA